MKYSFVLAFTFILLNHSVAQTKSKSKLFIAVVRTTDKKVIKGLLYSANDSGVQVTKNTNRFSSSLPYPQDSLWTIPAETIHALTLKRRGSVGRGVAFGALNHGFDVAAQSSIVLLGGAAVGVLVGGAAVGGLLGARKKIKFNIGGDKEKFRISVPKIKKYSILKN
jgi:hypothetical protein